MICLSGKNWVGCALVFYLFVEPLMAANFSASLRVVPEYHYADKESPFFLPEDVAVFDRRNSRQELELSYRRHGINGQVLLRNQVQSSNSAKNEAQLNELYWDTTLLDQDITLGKKVMSWGVGFGFRPLDVIQREDRRRLYTTPLEGVPLLAWEYFSADTAATLVITNPHDDKEGQSQDDASIAFKLYRLQGETDLHGVARWSKRQRWEMGGGLVQVIGDHLEWHASLLYQNRYERRLNPLAETDGSLLAQTNPLQTELFNHGIKAVIGGSWSGVGGGSLLAEIWYDEQAYSTADWRNIAALTTRQRALLTQPGLSDQGIFSNIASSSRYFQADNLLRWNTLIRLSYDRDDLTLSLDLLYTPKDAGYVLTFNTAYEHDQQRLIIALRRYGGADGAAYQLLPEQWIALAAWEWMLN